MAKVYRHFLGKTIFFRRSRKTSAFCRSYAFVRYPYERWHGSYQLCRGSYGLVRRSYQPCYRSYQVDRGSYRVVRRSYRLVWPSYQPWWHSYRFVCLPYAPLWRSSHPAHPVIHVDFLMKFNIDRHR